MSRLSEQELFEICPVPRAVIDLALPTVIGQVILVIYNMADTFFVGLTGRDDMITAVTVCMPAFMFLSAISNLFGVGGASVIARALGYGREEDARNASSFAFWACLASAAVYSLLALLFLDDFVDILGGTAAMVHAFAREYITCTVIAGGIFTAQSTLLSHLIRSEGRALHASVGIALGGILNIALDPLFMFILLPRGRETLGAALATMLSNCFSLLYFIIVLLILRGRGKTLLSYKPGRLRRSRGVRRDILVTGIPACVMTLFENISYAVVDKLMSYNGLQTQAGIGVAKKVNMLAHSMVRGVTQGSMPLIAYNYASGDHRRMKSSLLFSGGLSVALAAVCTAAYLFFAPELVGLFFRYDSQSWRYGVSFLRILCIGAPFSALAYTCISFFQAVGEGRSSFRLAILRKGLVDIPMMFGLAALFPIYGIVWATPMTDALCCAVSAFILARYLRRLAGRKSL